MNKPNQIAFRLFQLNRITGICVEYRQTGTDTAETFCEIFGTGGSCKGLWRTYKDFLSVSVSYNSVATLLPKYITEIKAWNAYEEQNRKELLEYVRLKKKFGGGA